ncbi:MAG: mechanosensitive ion channel [Methylotetracoccus sp.]|nr:mechanosensitive ion channel [Methylotetracoccus sp.]
MFVSLGCREAAGHASAKAGVLLALILALLSIAPATSASQALRTPLTAVADPRNAVAFGTAGLPAATPEEVHAEIERKLAKALAWQEKLSNVSAADIPPSGIGEEEAAERRRLIDSLVFYYRAQIRAIAELMEAQKARADAEARGRGWPGFDEPPPYSILMVDQLGDAVEAARGKVAALESSQALLDRAAARQEDTARLAESAARRAAEEVERAATPVEAEQARWRREQAELRERVAQNSVALRAWTGSLTAARLAASRAELALFQRQFAEASKNAAFTDADLEKLRETAKQEIKQLEQELQSALTRSAKRTEEREAAELKLAKARMAVDQGAENAPGPSELELLDAKLRAAQTALGTARLEAEAMNNLIALNRASTQMWEYRYTLANSRDAAKRRDALERLQQLLDQVKPWRAYLLDQLALARAEELKQKSRLDSLAAETPIRRFEQESLEAFRARKGVIERLQGLTDRTERSLRRWLDEYETERRSRSLADRLADRTAAAARMIRRIWDYELFTVEDTLEIEGQKVETRRGITFGKSIGAMMLFAGGYALSALFARRLQRMLVRRFQIDEPVANVFRRWMLVFLTLLLSVIVLTLVRIPLTVFAFLGGALAIGVGFGTQTLLKNLISGVMVLVERKIKVGDIVEVDGIVGTVTEVDIRSSTVRGFDGVETMIPNAGFLEQKVSNWTYSSRTLRRRVKVGVSYGSPVRRSAEILLECTGRHGLVMKEPKPFVWLEDFGDNAIVFGLYFWVELAPNVNSFQVMSDLRFMIVEAFGKAGISIAFPQRDVHFDAVRPLKIEVMNTDSHRQPNV